MSGQHAGPVHPAVPGECIWTFHHEDVDLYCEDIPTAGEVLCELHRHMAEEATT